MYSWIRELLFHPASFFDRKNQEKPGLLIPALIVGIGSIVGVMTPFILSVYGDMPDPLMILQMQGSDLVSVVVLFISYLVFPFIAWLCIALTLSAISAIFSGTGSFIRTLQNSGYGCLPLTIISPITIINGIAVAQFSEFPSGPLTFFVLGLGVVWVVFVLWSGWLWSVAIRKTHSLSARQAFIPATFAVMVYLCPVLLNIAQMLPGRS